MVLAAFLRTGAVDDVRQIVVAGDTSYDMLSGVRSGAGTVVGVLSGSSSRHDLDLEGVTAVVASIGEATDLILARRPR